jgi:sec-independent protein translocase protein TatB
MFDISWTEFLLIAVVALVVIGPKELPAVMRTLGQWTRKVRSMAADFQNQFHEAMREAEMGDLKKQVDDMAHDVTQFDPLKDVRDNVEAMNKDFENSLNKKLALGGSATEPAGIEAIGSVQVDPQPSAEFPIPEAAAELRDKDVVGAATGPVVPESAENAGRSERPGRTG